jgi:hypothetical protein
VLLLLADDLQDVEEDRRAGVRTVFAQDAERTTLDECTSRTLYFGQWVMGLLGELPVVGGDALIGVEEMEGAIALWRPCATLSEPGLREKAEIPLAEALHYVARQIPAVRRLWAIADKQYHWMWLRGG